MTQIVWYKSRENWWHTTLAVRLRIPSGDWWPLATIVELLSPWPPLWIHRYRYRYRHVASHVSVSQAFAVAAKTLMKLSGRLGKSTKNTTKRGKRNPKIKNWNWNSDWVFPLFLLLCRRSKPIQTETQIDWWSRHHIYPTPLLAFSSEFYRNLPDSFDSSESLGSILYSSLCP